MTEPDFTIRGEFVAGVCTPESLSAFERELPTKWTPQQKKGFVSALHAELQLRWGASLMEQSKPPAYWRERLRAVAEHAAEVQTDLKALRATENLFIALEGAYAYQALCSWREEGEVGTFDAPLLEDLAGRLWRDLESVRKLALDFAADLGHEKSAKVSTHNSAVLARCLVDAYVRTFGKLPPYSRSTLFANIAARAACLLGLAGGTGSSLDIGHDLLRRVVDETKLPPV